MAGRRAQADGTKATADQGRATKAPVAPIASAPSHVVRVQALQRSIGNKATARMFGGQSKLTVGPAGDQYEQEADAVARDVVQSLAGQAGIAAAPPPPPSDQDETLFRHAQRSSVVGLEGGPMDSASEGMLRAERGRGAPLPNAARRSMEGAMGADFSGVRIHAGARSADLNDRIQAKAFTVGRDIYFGAKTPDLGSRAGKQLLAHELTHTIQQGAATARPNRVQRHSSWEHALLGDASPDTLAKIGTWEDITEPEVTGGQSVKVTVGGVGTFNKGDVMHVLAQEMVRLKEWQEKPPDEASTDDPFNKTKKDPKFEVFVVRLPAEDPKKSMLITYGEMNTLADFYGDIETMKTASPKQRNQIVQSVRKETYLRLRGIYKKIEESLSEAEANSDSARGAKGLYSENKLGTSKFAGAAAPDFISGVKGQADLLAGDKPLIGQGTGAKGGTNKYGATLARNACHFVPESWHAWPGTTRRPARWPLRHTTTSRRPSGSATRKVRRISNRRRRRHRPSRRTKRCS